MKLFAVGVILCLALDSLRPCAAVTTVGLYAPDRYEMAGIPEMCLMSMDVGYCKAKVKRYYFDVHRMKCTMFYWGGCAGNINNFKSSDECNKVCLVAFEVDGRVNKPSKEPARINYISRNSSGFTNNNSGRNNTSSNFKAQKMNNREISYNNNNNYDDNNYDKNN